MSVQTRAGRIRQYEETPFELIDAERLLVASSAALHVLILKIIYVALLQYEQSSGIGVAFAEAPFALADTPDWVKDSRVPDASFYVAERGRRISIQ